MMVCRFEYNGKTYSQDELAKELEKMPPSEAHKYIPGVQNVPNMPFKKNWDELALKKIIHKAASEGYEGVSWTPGEAQAARYDLSKQVKHIEYKKLDDGDIALGVEDLDGRVIPNIPYSVKPEKLADYFGKDVAEKIIQNANDTPKFLKGDNLKVGGEGMKGFYDKILVDRANNLAKKFGSKVEQKQIDISGGKSLNSRDHSENDGVGTIHYLPLTPGLKDTALRKGFPLFSAGISFSPIEHNPFVVSPVDHDPFEEKKK